tara:strand:- start:2007 stop:2900 length:894 start_codon:yes stop_codon:yes gene_type:complete
LNINKLLLKNKSRLESSKIEEAELESEIIVMHVLNLNKSDLLLNLQKCVTESELKKNDDIIKKRQKNIPLAYILKYQYFYKAKFYVNNQVLIPRQETEILVEICLSILKNIKSKIKILEIGTGSGIITGTLSQILKTKNIKYIATDISIESLKIAKHNILKVNKNTKLSLINNDLINGLKGEYKFIISNPPYLSRADMKTINKELKSEPVKALYGGYKGYETTEKILKQLNDAEILFENLILEINPRNKTYLLKMIKQMFSDYCIYLIKDYNGNDRFILLTKNNATKFLDQFNYFPN